MSDEAAFLAAIAAEPADDTRRLVYADWLDERGDPRGEYLRLELQLHEIPARLAVLLNEVRGWAKGTLPTYQDRKVFFEGIVNGDPDPVALLRAGDEAAVREGLEGNLCRCTGYHNIVKAVMAAAGSEGGPA